MLRTLTISLCCAVVFTPLVLFSTILVGAQGAGSGVVSVQSDVTNLTGTSVDITLDEINPSNSWVRLTTRIAATANAHDVTGQLIDSTTLRLTRESDTGTNEVAWFVVEDSNANVQRGVYTMEATEDDETFAISSVDLTRAFIAITVRSEGGDMNVGHVAATFEDATTVRLRRQNDSHRIHVSWEVVEIADATVQRGYTNLTGTSVAESITAVDQSTAFIISHRSSATQNLDQSHALSRFSSDTEIEFVRQNSSNDMYIGWFVIENPRYTVQVADSGLSGNQVENTTIDAVDLTRTWLTTSSQNTGGGTSNANARYNVYFDGTDTVVRHKAATSQNTQAHTFAIEMTPAQFGSTMTVMSGEQYSIQTDSLNFGGGFSDSETFSLKDTLGEIATGDSASETFQLRAGYRQLLPVAISLTPPDSVVLDPAIPGVTGGFSFGSTSVTVTTDNPAGYELLIQAAASPALQGPDGATIGDYEASGAADYNFATSSTMSHLAISVLGEDTAQRFLHDGTNTCGLGSVNTPARCWAGLSTSLEPIATRSSSNHPDGRETIINFQVGVGDMVVQPPGVYVATTTVTALPL